MSSFFHCQIVLNRRNSGNTLSNFPCEIYLRLIGRHSYKRSLELMDLHGAVGARKEHLKT
jgi:hypothetical protein